MSANSNPYRFPPPCTLQRRNSQLPHKHFFLKQENEAQIVSLNLFGFIPIKEVEVESIRTPMLVPCGQPFGIKMLMDGVMIVKESGVQTETGVCCPAADAGLQEGDILHSVNGTAISSNQALREQILQSMGRR